MKLLVVSGRRARGLLGGGPRRTLVKRLEHFHWAWTECALDDLIAEPSRLHDIDDVAIIGGDGTVRSLLEITHPRPILIIPAGTGNDLARALGIEDAFGAAELLRRGHRRRIDLGAVSCDGRSERFANGVGIGLDGIIAARHAAGLPYALGAALSLARLPRWRIRIELDGAATDEAILSLGVANGPWCGGGFRMAPQARLDDGLLDLVGVHPVSIRDYLAWLPKARTGDHLDHPAVFTARTRRVVIEAREPIPLHVDGEPRRARRIEIEIRPGDRKFFADGWSN